MLMHDHEFVSWLQVINIFPACSVMHSIASRYIKIPLHESRGAMRARDSCNILILYPNNPVILSKIFAPSANGLMLTIINRTIVNSDIMPLLQAKNAFCQTFQELSGSEWILSSTPPFTLNRLPLPLQFFHSPAVQVPPLAGLQSCFTHSETCLPR